MARRKKARTDPPAAGSPHGRGPELGEPQRVAYRVAFRPDSSRIVRTTIEADDYESAVNLAATKLGLDITSVIEGADGK